MPYCPKCDMEFIEGVTVCSDCGGPLFESEEAARQYLRKQEKLARKEMEVPEMEPVMPEEGERAGCVAFSGVYVKKEERYEEMKSSASAFLVIGCAALALALLSISGILPVAASVRITFTAVLAVMGILCLIVCVRTKKAAAAMKTEAKEENQKTAGLIRWFLDTHSAESIDQKLEEEAALLAQASGKDRSADMLSPEELSLKRYELILDLLVTEQDLPDQTYAESLCEEIYNQLYGQD